MNKYLFLIPLSLFIGTTHFLMAMEPIKIPKRLLVLATHPDDSLMSAGLIQRVIQQGGKARVVDLTAGDYDSYFGIRFVNKQGYRKHSNDAVNYGYYRQLIEDRRAVKEIGLKESDLQFLGYPDGGMKEIWDLGKTGSKASFTSQSTGLSHVPYEMAVTPGAPFTADSVINDIAKILKEFKPDAFVLSHPNDHHFDHSTTFYFGIEAVKAAKMDTQAIQILLPLDACGTDLKIGLDSSRIFTEPKKLPSPTKWFELVLTQEEVQRKQNLIQSHQSQFADEHPHTSDPSKFGTHSFMLSYLAKNELFGVVDKVVIDEDFQKSIDRREFYKRLWAAFSNTVRGFFQ